MAGARAFGPATQGRSDTGCLDAGRASWKKEALQDGQTWLSADSTGSSRQKPWQERGTGAQDKNSVLPPYFSFHLLDVAFITRHNGAKC